MSSGRKHDEFRLPLSILRLDVRKAFDSVEWDHTVRRFLHANADSAPEVASMIKLNALTTLHTRLQQIESLPITRSRSLQQGASSSPGGFAIIHDEALSDFHNKSVLEARGARLHSDITTTAPPTTRPSIRRSKTKPQPQTNPEDFLTVVS